MRSIRSAGVAALSGLALVGPAASASAATVSAFGPTVTITFTGTVSASTDPGGIFGCGTTGSCASGNPYSGDTYTAVFTFNTGVGEMLDEPGAWLYTEGGSSLPTIGGSEPPTPLVGDATVTVNGVSYDLGGGYYATLQSYGFAYTPGALPNTLYADVYDANGNSLYALVSTTTTPPQFPVSLTTPFSGDFAPPLIRMCFSIAPTAVAAEASLAT